MTFLARYDAACKALADARSVDEVMDIQDKAVAMQAYARQIKNRQLEADAFEIRERATKRLGEMIEVRKETVGLNQGAISGKTGTKSAPVLDSRPTLADLGIDKKLSSRSQRLAAVPEDRFETMIAQGRDKILHSNGKGTIATLHTGDHESYTPAKYVEAARSVLGMIDLDPASNETAQRVVKAGRWYGVEDDGLTKHWSGRVFLNPPYSYPLVSLFIEKLCGDLAAGHVDAAVLLTNNNTDTRWWQLAARTSGAVCLTLGRINFYKADGSETQPTNGQSFFYFGPNAALFGEMFSQFGLIMTHDQASKSIQRSQSRAV